MVDPIAALVHITGHVLIRLGTAALGEDTPEVTAPITVQHNHIHHHHYETPSVPTNRRRWGKGSMT